MFARCHVKKLKVKMNGRLVIESKGAEGGLA